MRVIPPSGVAATAAYLSDVNPGRTVQLENPEGVPGYYQVCKFTPNESNISPVPGKRMLVNLETGRVVMKPGNLQVMLLSATAKTHYHY